MVKFPADLHKLDDLEVLFKHAAVRSALGRSGVRVPQLPRLHQIVRDISRTPSGERVKAIFRQVNLWTDESVSSTILPPAGASALLSACASEASSLLELGYRREDGIDFITALPDPAHNPVRTTSQIRAAVHHIGGDMSRFIELLERPEPSSPELKLVFSVWPTGGRLPDAWRPGEETLSLHLSVDDSSVPIVVSFSRRLLGYGLLCMWDLASGIAGENRNIRLSTSSFSLFSELF
ncbi:MAG: hypothetical protein B1H09_03140 [Gemmatimonadaceae bacterium 4484_173]|nr:MAG: hypothetical protein B1H09_03140 [Gemmatimonadaceae bacterium 4484_173]RKZ03336.1 MAG: hypothetical protein DRQ21_06085 [Candidatus Fermentibacteria bacterium]